MNPLILVNNENNGYFINEIATKKIFYIFKNENIVNRIYRKMILKTNIPIRRQLFTHWEKKAEACDTIILFDTGNACTILKYLKQYYPDKRLIFWYWNRVARSIPVEEIRKTGVEIWSYDPGDCKEYGLKYNNQFVFPSNYLINSKAKEVKYDTFFLGIDKNRSDILADMAKKFKELGCSYYYYLVRSYNKAENKAQQEFPYRPFVTYQKLLDMSSNSKALIDIVDSEQYGLTLRPIECIFLKKKLITTMRHISDHALYNPDNVFIWGSDDYSRLNSFLNSPFNENNNKMLMEEYSFSNWLQHFEEGVEGYENFSWNCNF